MPLEGRDYAVNVETGTGGAVKISIVGLTDLGKAFADHCMKNLVKTITQSIKEQYGHTERIIPGTVTKTGPVAGGTT